MSDVSERNASLQQALTGGALQLIGEYRFYFDQERWERFDQLFLTAHNRVAAKNT